MASFNDLVSQNSGAMPDRVAALGKTSPEAADLVKQLVDIQNQQVGLQKSKAGLPSIGEQLTSLPGILSALAAGGAAATGGQGGADAAAGLLGGFLEGAQAKNAAAEAKIADQQDQTQKMLDANRQRLSTMIASNPNLLVNSETGESVVDPRLIGYAATGFLIPIDPGAAHRLAKKTATQRDALELGTALLLNGDTPEKRQQGGYIVNNVLGLKLDDKFFDDISTVDETGQWSMLMARESLDPSMTLRAWAYAKQNGLTLADPKVIGMLSPAIDAGGGNIADTIPKRILQLTGIFNERIAAAGDAMLGRPLAEQLEFAFPDEAGDLALMKNNFMGSNAFGTGVSGGDMLNLLTANGQLLSLVWNYSNGNDPMLKRMGITSPGDIWVQAGKMSNSAVESVKIAQSDAASENLGRKTLELTRKLNADGVDYQDAANKAALIVRQLKDKHTTAGGEFDNEQFNAEYTTILLTEKEPTDAVQ